ncbi:Zinc finger and BTB domain-containing protein 47 [Eumeta japonica]|uniref:Zinc finger and BTB domain-containing protein 47 n=1 Tax=Eumeta variegata TaxID=151549 RepID=A0A4C1V490_EUMVA|nr:Zinc finger and BTB domain-containing protein 47 [Eumeta japonica]
MSLKNDAIQNSRRVLRCIDNAVADGLTCRSWCSATGQPLRHHAARHPFAAASVSHRHIGYADIAATLPGRAIEPATPGPATGGARGHGQITWPHNGVLIPTLMYGSESWVWQKERENRFNAVEMRSLHSMCGVSGKGRCRERSFPSVSIPEYPNLDRFNLRKAVLAPAIEENDGLPSQICSTCYNNLETAYQFKRKFLEAENTLRRLLLKSKYNIKCEYVDPKDDVDSSLFDDGAFSYENNLKAESVQVQSRELHEEVIIKDEKKDVEEEDHVSTQESSLWSQNIIVETGHNPEQANRRHAIDVIRSDKKKERQQRYREKNREKLKQREAERRKRKQNFQINMGPSDFSNVNITELNNEEIADDNSPSLSGLEGTRTPTVQENEHGSQTTRVLKGSSKGTICKKRSKRLWCNICELDLKTRADAKEHRKSHQKNVTWVCEICGKVFRHRASHITHLKSHRPPRFSCDQCDYRTSHKHDLAKHIRIHSGIKRYQCSYCPSSFHVISNLKSHERRTHQRVRDHICPVCSRLFFDMAHLKRHIDSHNEVKRFTCDICGSAYSRRCYWVKHMERQHEQMVQKIRPGRQKTNFVIKQGEGETK